MPAGRHCLRPDSTWRTEFLFDVYAAGAFRKMRIVLPEAEVGPWERKHARRLSEAARIELAKSTLESLIESSDWPDTRTIATDDIQNLTP